MKCMERFRLPWKHCDSGIFAADAGDLPSRFRFDLQRFADGDKTEEEKRIEDLRKAIFYINDEIERIEGTRF